MQALWAMTEDAPKVAIPLPSIEWSAPVNDSAQQLSMRHLEVDACAAADSSGTRLQALQYARIERCG